MTLSAFMTATATTQRMEAMTGGKRGDLSAHLSGVKVTPPMLPSATGQHAIRSAIGLEGTAMQVWECFTQKHSHTDDSVSVNQVPDILKNDRITIDSVTYVVRWAKENSLTSGFGKTLLMYLTEDEIE